MVCESRGVAVCAAFALRWRNAEQRLNAHCSGVIQLMEASVGRHLGRASVEAAFQRRAEVLAGILRGLSLRRIAAITGANLKTIMMDLAWLDANLAGIAARSDDARRFRDLVMACRQDGRVGAPCTRGDSGFREERRGRFRLRAKRKGLLDAVASLGVPLHEEQMPPPPPAMDAAHTTVGESASEAVHEGEIVVPVQVRVAWPPAGPGARAEDAALSEGCLTCAVEARAEGVVVRMSGGRIDSDDALGRARLGAALETKAMDKLTALVMGRLAGNCGAGNRVEESAAEALPAVAAEGANGDGVVAPGRGGDAGRDVAPPVDESSTR